MADKSMLIGEKLDYTGLFNFSGMYKFAHSWLSEEEGYGVVEEKYSEKIAGNSKEIGIEWVATKKMGDYFKVELKIEFKVSDLTDVEVEIDKTKKKMQKGKVSIGIKGAIIKDPGSKWEGSNFDKFLRGWYDKFIIPQKIDNTEGKVRSDVQSFKEELKSYLELSAKR
jgi:hypothetical protein